MKKQVLLFNLNGQRRQNVEAVCRKLSLDVYVVEREHFKSPLGSLVGIRGLSLSPGGTGNAAGEMLIFYGLSSDDLDRFLESYREEETNPVKLKAVLTPHNMSWDAGRLYEELEKERKEIG